MATIQEELDFRSLGRDVEQVERELAQLELAAAAWTRDRAVTARRLEAVARSLGRRLDQQSAAFWMLLQDPARQSLSRQLQARIERAFDRILALLGPAQVDLGRAGLAEKVQAIQDLCRQVAGHRALQPTSLPHVANWRHAPAGALEQDTWASLVVLAAILLDFVHTLPQIPGELPSD
jgi:hypothetical protein